MQHRRATHATPPRARVCWGRLGVNSVNTRVNTPCARECWSFTGPDLCEKFTHPAGEIGVEGLTVVLALGASKRLAFCSVVSPVLAHPRNEKGPHRCEP